MTTELSLAAITIYPDLQPRVGGLDPAHIRSLEETPDAWPPVVVVRHESGYLLIDGFHRLAAAQNLGRQSITAEVLDPPADGDLRGLAFRLNLHHGRPLSLADRRAYAAHILQTRPELSDRAIGEMAALSGNTVTAIRRALEAAAQIERPTERVGRGGYVYREPDHQPGELPDQGLGATLGDVAATLFSSAERVRQRRWTSYLQRLATALCDQYAVPGWTEATLGDIVRGCRLVLGDEKARTLAQQLGPSARNVVTIAELLGDEVSAEGDAEENTG